MPKFYAHIGSQPLGEEGLGTTGRHIWEDLKTVNGAVKRMRAIHPGEYFRIYTFTNFYDDKTFKLAAKHDFEI